MDPRLKSIKPLTLNSSISSELKDVIGKKVSTQPAYNAVINFLEGKGDLTPDVVISLNSVFASDTNTINQEKFIKELLDKVVGSEQNKSEQNKLIGLFMIAEIAMAPLNPFRNRSIAKNLLEKVVETVTITREEVAQYAKEKDKLVTSEEIEKLLTNKKAIDIGKRIQKAIEFAVRFLQNSPNNSGVYLLEFKKNIEIVINKFPADIKILFKIDADMGTKNRIVNELTEAAEKQKLIKIKTPQEKEEFARLQKKQQEQIEKTEKISQSAEFLLELKELVYKNKDLKLDEPSQYPTKQAAKNNLIQVFAKKINDDRLNQILSKEDILKMVGEQLQELAKASQNAQEPTLKYTNKALDKVLGRERRNSFFGPPKEEDSDTAVACNKLLIALNDIAKQHGMQIEFEPINLEQIKQSKIARNYGNQS